MTANEAVTLIGELRPHPLPEAVLFRVLGELDGQVSAELLSRYEAGEGRSFGSPFDPQAEPDRPLIVPFPYDGLYIHRLSFAIDTALGETARANNSAALFNRAWQSYAAYINRTCAARGETVSAGFGACNREAGL